jgi:hypothetical protein
MKAGKKLAAKLEARQKAFDNGKAVRGRHRPGSFNPKKQK